MHWAECTEAEPIIKHAFRWAQSSEERGGRWVFWFDDEEWFWFVKSSQDH